MRRPDEAADAGPVTSHESTLSTSSFAIRIVQIIDGSALFADYSITPSFATGIVDLDGTISGLSSKPNSRAKVQLAGKVDRYAPVDITAK